MFCLITRLLTVLIATMLIVSGLQTRNLIFANEVVAQKKIQSHLESMKDQGFAFSVFVSLNGKPILQEGYGWSDSAKKCKTDVHTLFNIASITKSFTAIAIFQLRRAGKLKLDDPLPKFFKNVPNDKKAITVQQLLIHTSGLEQNYAADNKKTRDAAVQAILGDPLGFKPGSNFSYSNENFALLAAIIEIVTGETYESFVRTNILQRAGMEETKFWDEVDPRKNDCNVASLKRTDVPAGTRDWGYVGSGGIYSSVIDLQRWFVALNEGRLLDSADLQSLWNPVWKAGSAQIASGWYISETDGLKEIWTRGSEDWGHNAVLRWFPDRNLLIIVATNSGELGDKNTTGNRLISGEIVGLLIP